VTPGPGTRVSVRPLRRPALLIDAERGRRGQLGAWLAAAGLAARIVEEPEKARAELRDGAFDLALADPGLLDGEGLRIFESYPSCQAPVTGVCGGDGAPGGRLSRLGGLVGASEVMQQVYRGLLRVAPTSATVFLVGESGTGKERAAELVHALGPRAAGPFVPLNCGAIPRGLAESELFGHERGSFTGARARRSGLFERARGGTLFLDEITEMPRDLQVKLLRVLECRSVQRVGGGEPIDVDVRVVAATNRDPEEAVREGRLRADLLHRLNVFPLRLPPLRERAEDVPLLARHLLAGLNAAADAPRELTTGAEEALSRLPWRGNVRELRNVVERAFILSDGRIDEHGLPAAEADAAAAGASEASEAVLQVRVGERLVDTERRLILATVAHFDGDKKKAAEALGVSVKTVYARLSVYRATEARAPRASP